MSTSTLIDIPRRLIKLPPLGTLLPHLGGAFWALQRGRPGSGQADYGIIVPPGAEAERKRIAWGGARIDAPEAACMWDGQANTLALLKSGRSHPAAEFCAGLEIAGFKDFYLPALREIKALFASGCDAFATDAWYLTSTQDGRNYAFDQLFGGGYTYGSGKYWEGGSARAVRRVSLESLID